MTWRNTRAVPSHPIKRLAAAGAICVAVAAALAVPAAAQPNPGLVVGDTVLHDPSMVIREGDDPKRWAVYSTLDQVHYSPLLRFVFTRAGVAHPNRPLWWTDWAPLPWAPDVSYHDGKYWMYYALSEYGTRKSAIGLSTSPTGDPGSWTDRGIVMTSSDHTPYNAIDPNLIVDDSGRWWLTFGSFWGGIYQVEVNPTTGKLKDASPTFKHLATAPGTAIEAPFIYRHGGYYYLFVSWGKCCVGASSTYSIKVGRSTSPNGPFKDRGGNDMTAGYGTHLLGTHGSVVRGPGGQSVVYDSWDDKDLLVYHYYEANTGGWRLGINYLGWDSDGWPYVW